MFMRARKLFFHTTWLAAVIGVSAFVTAQETKTSFYEVKVSEDVENFILNLPPAPFKQVKELGKPIVYSWPDGREAKLQMGRNKPFIINAAVEVVANDCTDTIGQECTLMVPYSEDAFRIVWTKHPDTEKIGKALKSTKAGETSYNEDQLNRIRRNDPMHRFLIPRTFKALPTIKIKCTDWASILPQKKATESFVVSTWQGEDTQRNPETKDTETSSDGAAYGVTLNKVEEQTYSADSVESIYSRYSGYNEIVGGSRTVWTLEKSKGQFCQISYKMQPIDLFALAYGEYRDSLANVEYRDYLYGEDEFFNDPFGYEQSNLLFLGIFRKESKLNWEGKSEPTLIRYNYELEQ